MVASQPARPITNQPIDKKSFEKFTQTNLGYLRFRTAGVAASFPESQFQPADNVNYKQHIVSTYTRAEARKVAAKKSYVEIRQFCEYDFTYDPTTRRKN